MQYKELLNLGEKGMKDLLAETKHKLLEQSLKLRAGSTKTNHLSKEYRKTIARIETALKATSK